MFNQSKKEKSSVKFTIKRDNVESPDKLSMDQYHGHPHEHFVFFKKQFEFIAEEAKWTEADKLWNLQRALNGAALMNYISFGPQDTLVNAMKRLQLQFVGEDPYAQYYNELRAYRQGKQQSTAQYKLIFDSKVYLCDISGLKSDKITEKDKLFAFIRGLRPE
eukprot:NODE_800_length_3823_cov_0.427766.p3 type:complete len:162 gc:universal NODE_800_length_3823_cov_0.427766:3730-3245(-)